MFAFVAVACSSGDTGTSHNTGTSLAEPTPTTTSLATDTTTSVIPVLDPCDTAHMNNETTRLDASDIPTLEEEIARRYELEKEAEAEKRAELRSNAEKLRSNAENFKPAIGNRGGVLTIATISEPLTFNLAVSKDSGSSYVLDHVFEGLTRVSWLTDEVEPELAKSWETSQKGKVWTFHLRENVKWHDGEDFTSEDVVFTFNQIIYNDDIDASDRAQFNFQSWDSETGDWIPAQMTVEALNDYIVQFTLPEPFAPFLRAMTTAIYPEHILKNHVDRGTFYSETLHDTSSTHNKTFTVETVWDINANPAEIIGTGPFTISEYTPLATALNTGNLASEGENTAAGGESTSNPAVGWGNTASQDTTDVNGKLVLKRNPLYWLKDSEGNVLPYLDQIVLIIVSDLDDELESFKSGISDYLNVRGEDYQSLLSASNAENFTLHRRGPGFGSTFLAFNMNPDAVTTDTQATTGTRAGVRDATGGDTQTGVDTGRFTNEKLSWFTNQTFRQAVAHSVDRNRIITEVQHNLAYPQWSSVSPSAGDFHNPEVRRYPYDIDTAKQLLDCLGWMDTDEDGIREDTKGNPITFTIATNMENNIRVRTAEIISEGLQMVGVQAVLDATTFDDMVDRLTNSYEWDTMLVGFGGSTEPHDSITLWHSSESLHLWHPQQDSPANNWERRIDEQYVLGSQENNRKKRVEFYHHAQEIAAEQTPIVYTTLSERIDATRNIFGNLTPSPYGLWDARYLYLLTPDA